MARQRQHRITLEGDGGPGWLNLIVLLAAGLKFLVMGPVSLVLLIRARLEERAHRRRKRRAEGTAEITHEYA